MAIDPTDDEDSIQAKVKQVEHSAYPKALELLSSGRAKLGEDGKVAWTKKQQNGAATNGNGVAMEATR